MAKSSDDLVLTLRALLLAAVHPLDVDTKIEILTKAGWNASEIGDAINLAPEAVRKRRSRKGRQK